MKTVPVLPGMFCWHELVTMQPAHAAQFYRDLFSGEVQSFPTPAGEYAVLVVEGAAVAGFRMASDAPDALVMDAANQWVAYVAVEDVDEACRRAVAAGGSVAVAPHDSTMGRGAELRDAQGARLAVFRSAPGATDGTNPVGAGAACWMELRTRDPVAAAAFYTAVFGWRVQVQQAPRGELRVADAGGTPVGAIVARSHDDAAAYNRWCPAFQVQSIDQAVKRVRALGGVEATTTVETPGIGRAFTAMDSAGAEVALLECAPVR